MSKHDQIADVADCMERAGISEADTTSKILAFRGALSEEEARELADAMGFYAPAWQLLRDAATGEPEAPTPARIEQVVRESFDVAYVAIGNLVHLLGEPCARDVWDAMQDAQMNKLPEKGLPPWTGEKFGKPPDWVSADVMAILVRHGVVPTSENCGSPECAVFVYCPHGTTGVSK